MTTRLASCSAVRRRPGSAAVALSIACLTALAGCASRSLNAPPVVDWSGGAPSTRPPIVSLPTQLYTVRRDDTLASVARQFNTTPNDLAAWNNLAPNARLKPDQVLRVSSPALAASGIDPNAPVATTRPIGSESVEQHSLNGTPDAPPSGSATPLPPSSNAPMKTGPSGVKRPYSDAALAEMSRPDGDAGTALPPVASAVLTPTPTPTPTAPPASTTGLSWSWPASGRTSGTFADGKTKGIDIPGKAGDPVLAAADGKVTFAGTGVRGYGNFVIIRHTPELLSVYAHNRSNLVKEGAAVTKGQKIAEMGATDSDGVMLHFEIRNDSKPVDPLKYLPER